MYVFRECSKFTSVFTLCALSVDRFLATFHQLGRYRQLRVGVALCSSIWLGCLALSSPYWLFGATVARTRRPPAAMARGDVTTPTGNVTAHALNETLLPAPLMTADEFGSHFYDDDDFLSNLDIDSDPEVNDLDLDLDLDPGKSQRHAELVPVVKTTCKLVWPSVRYRKSWTYALLVIGMFVPLIAIAIFNVLLIYRMRTLNRNKQKAGIQRMRRLTDIARMVLAVVIIFAVCQLPYHIMEIISVQVTPLHGHFTVEIDQSKFNFAY